jgi:opacity protein-like surface antigen
MKKLMAIAVMAMMAMAAMAEDQQPVTNITTDAVSYYTNNGAKVWISMASLKNSGLFSSGANVQVNNGNGYVMLLQAPSATNDICFRPATWHPLEALGIVKFVSTGAGGSTNYTVLQLNDVRFH